MPREYKEKALRAHSFLADVPLHDVTAFRLREGGEGRTLRDFQALFSAESLQRPNPVVSGLFRLRWTLGRLSGWDDEKRVVPESSYVHRLTDSDRTRSLDAPGSTDSSTGPFRVVYSFENEALQEIINATGHYFLAMTLEPSANGYTAYWAVYVKRTSWLTPVYMALIDPFRQFLVSPPVVKTLERAWERQYAGAQEAQP